MTQKEFFEELAEVYNSFEKHKGNLHYGAYSVQKERAMKEVFAIVDKYLGGKDGDKKGSC